MRYFNLCFCAIAFIGCAEHQQKSMIVENPNPIAVTKTVIETNPHIDTNDPDDLDEPEERVLEEKVIPERHKEQVQMQVQADIDKAIRLKRSKRGKELNEQLKKLKEKKKDVNYSDD